MILLYLGKVIRLIERLIKKYLRFVKWLFSRNNLYNNFNTISFDKSMKQKTSDTVFIFGSGGSINDIKSHEWEEISKHNTISLNWFMLQDFIKADFHVARRVLSYENDEGFRDKKTALLQISEYFKQIEINPLYKDTIIILQWEAESTGSQIAVNNNLINKNRKILPYKTNYNSISFDFNAGLSHQPSTLIDALNFACCGGWKNIVLVGVDLNNLNYFYLPSGVTTSFQTERSPNEQLHSTANNGVVSVIDNFNKLMTIKKMNLFVYSDKSMLAEKIPVYGQKK